MTNDILVKKLASDARKNKLKLRTSLSKLMSSVFKIVPGIKKILSVIKKKIKNKASMKFFLMIIILLITASTICDKVLKGFLVEYKIQLLKDVIGIVVWSFAKSYFNNNFANLQGDLIRFKQRDIAVILINFLQSSSAVMSLVLTSNLDKKELLLAELTTISDLVGTTFSMQGGIPRKNNKTSSIVIGGVFYMLSSTTRYFLEVKNSKRKVKGKKEKSKEI